MLMPLALHETLNTEMQQQLVNGRDRAWTISKARAVIPWVIPTEVLVKVEATGAISRRGANLQEIKIRI